MKRDKLFDLWEGRDPEFEVQYEEPIIKSLCDYGKGTSQYQESRAKVLGAGYEAYIMAFFIGLYFDKSMPLEGEMHIPADTRSAFPVISVQSPVSIQCCWQS